MNRKKNQTPSDDFAINLNRTLHFLSFRPRSEKEVIDYLKKKKVDSITALKILNKLKEHKFLNDEEFTKWFIEQRTKNRPRAARVISFELKQKGISDELIENSRSAIKSDAEMATELVEKRFSRYKNLPKAEIYQKLGRYLSARGFNWEIIKKSIDEKFAK